MPPSLLPAVLLSLACLSPPTLPDLLEDGKTEGQQSAVGTNALLPGAPSFAPEQALSRRSRSHVLISSFPRGRKGVGSVMDCGARLLQQMRQQLAVLCRGTWDVSSGETLSQPVQSSLQIMGLCFFRKRFQTVSCKQKGTGVDSEPMATRVIEPS